MFLNPPTKQQQVPTCQGEERVPQELPQGELTLTPPTYSSSPHTLLAPHQDAGELDCVGGRGSGDGQSTGGERELDDSINASEGQRVTTKVVAKVSQTTKVGTGQLIGQEVSMESAVGEK